MQAKSAKGPDATISLPDLRQWLLEEFGDHQGPGPFIEFYLIINVCVLYAFCISREHEFLARLPWALNVISRNIRIFIEHVFILSTVQGGNMNAFLRAD